METGPKQLPHGGINRLTSSALPLPAPCQPGIRVNQCNSCLIPSPLFPPFAPVEFIHIYSCPFVVQTFRKNKNYQTNPFCDFQLPLLINNLQLPPPILAEKTNPFQSVAGAPVSDPAHSTGFWIVLPAKTNDDGPNVTPATF